MSTAWRKSREPGWQQDIGYSLQKVLDQHTYEYSKPPTIREPGLHPCKCGWEGYWPDFQPHVADMLRAVVQARADEALKLLDELS